MKNKLIVLEGIDGAGKSTHATLLKNALKSRGQNVALFDFPQYKTPVGGLLEKLLKDPDFLALSPYIAALPFAIDRALAAGDIRKALKKGIVICNRYTQSSLAFQGAKLPKSSRNRFFSYLEHLEYRELGIPKPDLILLLSLSPSKARRRILRKKKDVHEKNKVFQKEVARVYEDLSRSRSWKNIDASGGSAGVQGRIWKEVSRVLQ